MKEVVEGLMTSRSACRGVTIVMRRLSEIDEDTTKGCRSKSNIIQ